MDSLILHHYAPSPYSEKIRLVLGYKALAWQSVNTPVIMPKPDLVALTGGYRRAPVLQIGADIFCDSALISDELDRRFPTPPLLPEGSHPLGEFVTAWADNTLFWRVARFVTGSNIDQLPDAFLQDRAAMWRAPGFDRARAKADVPHYVSQLRVMLPWLEQTLAGTSYIAGRQPSKYDFAVYHCLWFMMRATGADAVLGNGYPQLRNWMERIAAIGHGERTEIGANAAIAIAKNSSPAPIESGKGNEDATGLHPGDHVAVTPETFGTESVTGDLIAIDVKRIVLAVKNDAVGTVHVHFPRLNYVLARQ